MENDTVRTLGDNTLVDLWIEGKSRAITITREAIEASLRIAPGGDLSETDRREFVRTNLSLIVRAATERLRDDPAAERVTIDAGHLGGGRISGAGERRNTGDRRKGERRQRNLGPPGGVERRGR